MFRLAVGLVSGLAAAGGVGSYASARDAHTRAVEAASGASLQSFDEFFATNPQKKHAVVIGAGVAGVCSAYQLRQRGYEVAVIDAADRVSAECSYAAAGGMQRANPRVDAAMWRTTLESLMPFHSGFRFFQVDWGSILRDPHYMRWLWGFTHASLLASRDQQEERQKHMLSFTTWAINNLLGTMHDLNLRDRSELSHTGAIKLHFTQDAVDTASNNPKWGGDTDCEPAVFLTAPEVFELEPWLKNVATPVLGASYQTEAARANCPWLTEGLAETCHVQGVRFWLGTRVTGFETARPHGVRQEATGEGAGGERVSAIYTDRGTVSLPHGTAVVVAAGSWTPLILRKLHLYAPVYPLKGYNLISQLPANAENGVDLPPQDVPNIMVVDGHLYVSRFGKELRVASIGEFGGWVTAPRAELSGLLRARAKELMPHLTGVLDRGKVVCGLRPFVSDGVLLIGHVPELQNLYVNAGPGFNGWKVALGAGEVLARAVDGEDGADLPFDTTVFSPKGRIRHAPLFARACDFINPS